MVKLLPLSHTLYTKKQMEVCGCHFWYISWREWCFNRSSAIAEYVPIMFTPTSLRALLLNMQNKRWNLTRLSPLT